MPYISYYSDFGLTLIVIGLLYIIFKRLNKKYYILSLCKRVQTVDGTPLDSKIATYKGITIFGNNFDILKLTPAGIFQYLRNICICYKHKSVLLHFLLSPVLMIYNADDAEKILQSNNLISKGVVYDLVKPFLGDGLLISEGKKWHSRRKLLTPAFHFNILQTFIEVFKEECYKITSHLQQQIEENSSIHLNDFIPQFTLNNICETALGVKLENVEGSEEYRKTIHHIESIIMKRSANPLLEFDILFYLFNHADYNEQNHHLRIAHEFSSRVIQKRREEFHRRIKTNTEDFVNEYGQKRRYAMLDTLLDAEEKGFIDHEGICDEVNTFMFEGFDTTSTCLTFTLLNLALHRNIQEKCYNEIIHLDDLSTLKVFDLNKLVYLECVIKESLRLYPPVPFIARLTTEETIIGDLIFPKYTNINIIIYDILRDPKHFENPEEFVPERFTAENIINNKNAFAFIPFSAGPRNCIGQKFALLEIKILLISIIKNFILEPVTRKEDLLFENGLVLRNHKPIQVKFIKRT